MNIPVSYNASEDPDFEAFLESNSVNVIVGRSILCLLKISEDFNSVVKIAPTIDGQKRGVVLAYSGPSEYVEVLNIVLQTVVQEWKRSIDSGEITTDYESIKKDIEEE